MWREREKQAARETFTSVWPGTTLVSQPVTTILLHHQQIEFENKKMSYKFEICNVWGPWWRAVTSAVGRLRQTDHSWSARGTLGVFLSPTDNVRNREPRINSFHSIFLTSYRITIYRKRDFHLRPFLPLSPLKVTSAIWEQNIESFSEICFE